eukprot:11053942-Heterocapsa_arctica.AAC.1
MSSGSCSCLPHGHIIEVVGNLAGLHPSEYSFTFHPFARRLHLAPTNLALDLPELPHIALDDDAIHTASRSPSASPPRYAQAPYPCLTRKSCSIVAGNQTRFGTLRSSASSHRTCP